MAKIFIILAVFFASIENVSALNKPGSLAYVASSRGHVCNAIFLEKDILITLASCASDPTTGEQLGKAEIKVLIEQSSLEIADLLFHPEYKIGGDENNLLLIKLNDFSAKSTANIIKYADRAGISQGQMVDIQDADGKLNNASILPRAVCSALIDPEASKESTICANGPVDKRIDGAPLYEAAGQLAALQVNSQINKDIQSSLSLNLIPLSEWIKKGIDLLNKAERERKEGENKKKLAVVVNKKKSESDKKAQKIVDDNYQPVDVSCTGKYYAVGAYDKSGRYNPKRSERLKRTLNLWCPGLILVPEYEFDPMLYVEEGKRVGPLAGNKANGRLIIKGEDPEELANRCISARSNQILVKDSIVCDVPNVEVFYRSPLPVDCKAIETDGRSAFLGGNIELLQNVSIILRALNRDLDYQGVPINGFELCPLPSSEIRYELKHTIDIQRMKEKYRPELLPEHQRYQSLAADAHGGWLIELYDRVKNEKIGELAPDLAKIAIESGTGNGLLPETIKTRKWIKETIDKNNIAN